MKQNKLYSITGILCLLLLVNYANAQPQPKPVPVPDTRYGIGGTKTTTVDDNGLGIRTTTEEYFDGDIPPKLRERVVKTKNLIEGDSTIVKSEYTYVNKRQELDVKIEVKMNDKGEVMYTDTIHYLDDKVFWQRRHIKLPDGSWEFYDFNPKTGQLELKKDPIRRIRENGRVGYLAGNYPRTYITVGYSFLGTIGQDKNLTFPAGFDVGFGWYFNRNWGIMADISYNTRKEQEEKLCRTKLSVGLTYRILQEQGPNKIVPHVHILAGLGSETFKIGDYKTSAKGLIAALGGGADIRLSPSASLRFAADVFLNRLNDETLKDYRIVGGVVIHLSEIFDDE